MKYLMLFACLLFASCNPLSTEGQSVIDENHTPFLEIPGNFSIAHTESFISSISISWSSSYAADRYVVKYREISNPIFTVLDNNASSPFSINLSNNTIYEFVVVAVNPIGETLSNKVTGSSLYTNTAPVTSSFSPSSFNEDQESIIVLPYNDIDNDLGTSCQISSLTNVSVTTVCSCDVSGVCSVGVTGSTNFYGAANFIYSVTTNGATSNSSTVSLNISAINDLPNISSITAQTTNEDMANAVSFTISDPDNTLTCAGSVSGTSSDTTIVANGSIVITGVAPNCTATITPTLNQYGVSNITLTASDGSLTDVSTFALTVTAVNDAPTISAITSQTTNEDVPKAVSFTISDPDNTLTCAGSVSGTSSDTTIVSNGSIVITGVAPNCTATITPTLNQYGNSNITLTATDGSLSNSATFALTVASVNDAPTISAIASLTTNEDVAKAVSFTISDPDNTLTCTGSVSGTSSDTTIVANGSIVITGVAPNCTATITPTLNQYGVSNITLTATDGSLSNSATFALTVASVNDAPTISAITAQTTNEDVALAVNFTIADPDNSLTCSTSVSKASTNTTVLANSNIVITGTAPNCTATITPTLNQYGVSNITLTATDGSLSNSATFALTVASVNDAPTISAIASQTTNEDVAKAVSFTISDPDNTLTCAGSVSGSSSDTTIVANGSILITGVAPNCTATITPTLNQYGFSNITLTASDGSLTDVSTFALTVTAVNDAPTISAITSQTTNEDVPKAVSFTISDPDNTLTCAGSVSGTSSDTTIVSNGSIVITGVAPNCTATITPTLNQYGNSNITLTATDGSLSNSATFALTVASVNDAPTISAITSQTTNEDVAKAVSFTISDPDNTLTCAGSVSGTSSDTTIVANGSIVITGVAPNCTATITPTLNQYGVSNITLTATDGSLSNSATFALTVASVNDAPTISAITAQTTNEDVALAVNFTIADPDNSLTCSTSVSKASTNTTVLANSNIVITGTAPNCTATITPTLNQYGVSNITLTATDGSLSNSATFALTVASVNDAPTISAIASQTTNEDVAKAVSFTISDPDNTLTCTGSVSGTSSDTTIVANGSILITGTAPNCTATITPTLNQYGIPNITLTATDGLLSNSTTFALTVTAVNDAPTISAISSQTTDEDVAKAVSFTISDPDNTLTCSTSVSKASTNTTVLPNSNIVITGTAPNCTATLSSDINLNGILNITLTVSDGSLTSSVAFSFTVLSVPDIGGSLSMKGVGDPSYAKTIIFTSATLDEVVDMAEVCISEDTNLSGTISAGEKCNTQNWIDITSAIGASGTSVTTSWANYAVKQGVNGASFITALVPSCSTTRQYAMSLRVRSLASSNKGEIQGSLWTFWNPSCISTLGAWYDGNDSSTIFSDNTCLTSISNGGTVGCWKDRSSNSRNATQATAGSRPVWNSSSINSKPAITFLGKILQTATAATWLNNTPYTLVAFVSSMNGSKTRNYFFGTNSTATRGGIHFGRRDSTKLTFAQYGNDVDFNWTENNSQNIHICQKSGNATNNTFYYLNSTSLAPSTTATSGYLNTSAVLNVGAGFDTTTTNLDAKFGEGLIFTSSLTTLEREKIEGYLAWKWESVANLPVGHTYKSAPP